MNAATGSGDFVATSQATWLSMLKLDEEGQETGRTVERTRTLNYSMFRPE